MADTKITNAEATRLINMVKNALIAELTFPSKGETKEFDVIGDTKSDRFTIDFYRGKVASRKCNCGARIKKNGIMLLELHINPTNVHVNPGGEKIVGSHWHIYDEQFGRGKAFPALDVEDDNFTENAISFLNRFNVLKKPQIYFQIELAE